MFQQRYVKRHETWHKPAYTQRDVAFCGSQKFLIQINRYPTRPTYNCYNNVRRSAAPALVESDLGIAIGAGTDVAIESADVVLVRSDPRDVFAILALSRATYGKMIQNLLWATGYNSFAIPLAPESRTRGASF